MSYGSPVLRQHIVEFIRGTGVVTDGVVDASDTTSPWTWTVPMGVVQLSLSGCGSGAGGGGGFNSTAARAGGAGGGGALCVRDMVVVAVPLSSLTITIAAGGTGGAAGSAGTDGGFTKVAGILSGSPWVFASTTAADGICLAGGQAGINATSTESGGFSSEANIWERGTPPFGTSNGVGPIPNGSIDIDSYQYNNGDAQGELNLISVNSFAYPGQAGAAANTTASVAGGTAFGSEGTDYVLYCMGRACTAVGTTTGTESYGAGGNGGLSSFGLFGLGGAGQAAGGNATGYGAGGGGGGGSGAGGNGAPGYVRLIYWSQD